MIIIMDNKTWDKQVKKLVEPRDYVVGDATQDESCNIDRYSNCISMEGLAPGSKLVRLRMECDKDDVISESKLDELEQKWINHVQFKKYAMACVSAMLNVTREQSGMKHQNVFIIIRKKPYKIYGEMIRDEFNKLFMKDVLKDDRFTFCELYDEEPKLYKAKLSKEEHEILEDGLRKVTKKVRKKAGW